MLHVVLHLPAPQTIHIFNNIIKTTTFSQDRLEKKGKKNKHGKNPHDNTNGIHNSLFQQLMSQNTKCGITN